MKRLLKNTWYMIGWENELAKEGKFSRVVAETAIVVFKTGDGDQLGAVQDRCPHRFAPLSLGDVVAATWSARITVWSSTPGATA